jgi:arylsulfatase A-like enzyme
MIHTKKALLLSFMVSCILSAAGQRQGRPNVLMIAIDDLKPLLGCYGEKTVLTPHMDDLAKKGTVFLKNYCQQAVCAPTRASFLTGLRPDVTKVWDLKTQLRDMLPDVVTMPQYFRQQGYTTTGIGKVFDNRSVDKQQDAPSWSLPYEKVEENDYAQGFGRPRGQYQSKASHDQMDRALAQAKTLGLNPKETDQFMNNHRVVVEAANVPDDAYMDGAVARKAGRMLQNLAQQAQPFFLAVGFIKPHLPFVAPQKYWDLYNRESIELAAFQQFAKGSPKHAYQPSNELVGNYLLPDDSRFNGNYALQTDAVQQLLIHGYYAAVTYVDQPEEYLMDQLKKNGLDKNTIVVLWGDHGWHLGDHGIWNKHTNFEQATRSPLIIAAPGFEGDKKAMGVSEFVDVFPTLCELAGLPQPQGLAGTSLVPVLKNPAHRVKDLAQSQYPRGDKMMGYALRSERYRFVVWYQQDFRNNPVDKNSTVVAVELYDYSTDPLETENLALNPAYADQVNQMKESVEKLILNKQ